jgi:hypothetical protein
MEFQVKLKYPELCSAVGQYLQAISVDRTLKMRSVKLDVAANKPGTNCITSDPYMYLTCSSRVGKLRSHSHR